MTTAKKKVAKKISTKIMDANNSASRPPKKSIIKVNTEQIQDIFVDGMSNLSAGPAVVKISFYTNISSSETEIVRKTSLRLVMETTVMIDMVAKLQASILKNAGKLSGSLDMYKSETLELVDKLKGK